MTRKKNPNSKSRSLQIETLHHRIMLDGAGFIDPVFYGPTPYLSEADTPVGFVSDPDCDECVVGLETFEDDSLDFGIQIDGGQIIGPGFSTGLENLTDSVDGDDGLIDGTGQSNGRGYSYFTFGNSLTITLPSLMQSAGLVWTDGDPNITDVIFEAFDESGNSIGTINAGPIGDNEFMGTTAEDRFFGVSYGDGVSTGVASFTITNVGGQGIEIDHIQFANCSACCDIDLELTKSASVSTGEAGDLVTWTIEITNNPATATEAATGVRVGDLLPAGLTLNGVTVTNGSFTPGTGIWTLLGSLEPGETETLTLATTIDAGLANGTMLINTAQVIAADQSDVDSTPNNDDGDQSEDDEANAKVMVAVAQLIDLELNKEVDSSVVNSGDTVTWTVSVTNNADNATTAATGVTIDDALPSGLSVVSVTPSGNGTFAGNTWTLVDPLAPGATETLTVVTTIDAGLAGGTMLVNTAYVSAATETDVDSTPGDDNLAEDDADDAKVTIGGVIDLEVEKSVDATIVEDGETVTWTVTVTNNQANANVAATGVALTDILPSGLSVVSVTPSGNGTFAGDTWTLVDPLAPGATATLTVVSTVDDGLAGGTMLVNTAYVSAANETDVDSTPGDDNLAEDDADDAKITVKDVVDLELTKVLEPVTNSPANRVQWVLTLTNTSAANTDATGVVVTDTLPDGVEILDAEASGDSQYADGQWTINEAISPGESLTLNLLGAIDESLPGGTVLTNVAEVTAADQMDIDSVPANDDGDQSEDDEASADFVVPSSELLMLSGHSYVDTNNDGVFQAGELPLLGVEIQLMGTDVSGNAVNSTTFTNIDGFYKFNDLQPGNYMVKQTQPVQFVDGKDTAGNLGGDASVNDKITVELTGNGEDYNFGELGVRPEFVNKRLYLTSTPYTNWQFVDVRQASLWYSFDVDHQSFLEANAVVNDGTATIEIFDAEMNLVGSQDFGGSALLPEPILLQGGGQYYMQVKGGTVAQTLSLDITTPSVSVTGNQLVAVGTAVDDDIHLHLGNTTHVLSINGLIYEFDASIVTDLHIGAATGHDSVSVVGTSLDDMASVIGTSGEMSSNEYTVHTYSFDNTKFSGGGGYDYSQVYGSLDNDKLESLPNDTTLTTPQNVMQMVDFDRVDAYGRGGYDYASLYGTQSADHFVANEQLSVLKGIGHHTVVKGFERVDAFGRGGEDTASLHDSDQNDIFASTPTYAVMSTSTRLSYTKGFEHNTAVFSNGHDTARFLELTNGDQLIGAGQMAGVSNPSGRNDQALHVDHLFASGDDFGVDIEDFDGTTDIGN